MSGFRKFCSGLGEVVGAIGGATGGAIVGALGGGGTTLIRLAEGESWDEASKAGGKVFTSSVDKGVELGAKVGEGVGHFAPEVGGAILIAVAADRLRQRGEENGVEGLPSRGRTLVNGAEVGAKLGAAAAKFIDPT